MTGIGSAATILLNRKPFVTCRPSDLRWLRRSDRLTRLFGVSFKIRLFTALAPVASLAHVKSPVLLGRFAAPFVRATNRNGQLRTSRLQRLARMCQIGHSAQWFCSYVTEFLNGSNRKSQDRVSWRAIQIGLKLIPRSKRSAINYGHTKFIMLYRLQKRADVYYSHYPHDVSLKNVEHLSQLNSHIGFRKFDYGPEKNLKMYGTVSTSAAIAAREETIPDTRELLV